MRYKEKKKEDLSVHAMADAFRAFWHGLPEQKCPRLLEFSLRREDHTERENHRLSAYNIFASVQPSLHLRDSFCDPKTGSASDAHLKIVAKVGYRVPFPEAQCIWLKPKNRKIKQP
jgi:hypothetical protein